MGPSYYLNFTYDTDSINRIDERWEEVRQLLEWGESGPGRYGGQILKDLVKDEAQTEDESTDGQEWEGHEVSEVVDHTHGQDDETH